MALSGTSTTNTYGSGRYYRVTWTATQSIDNNTSEISWVLLCDGGSSWYAERTLEVTIAGKVVYSKSDRVERYAGQIASGKVTVTHNSSGNASFSIAIRVACYTSSVNLTSNTSFTLDTIPRISTLSVANGTLGVAQTLTVSRQSTAFSHSIYYSTGHHAGYIKTDGSYSASEVKYTNTSISFTPFISWSDENTSGTTVPVKYTIKTYNGSTLIGSNSYTVSCAIPSTVVPSVSLSISDANGYLSTYSAYVQGESALSVTLNASGAYGSTIQSYSTTADGKTYTGATFTTSVLTGKGTLTIKATVKDSRGRTATASQTIKVLEYSPPKITALKASRCDANGALTSNGAYLKVSFSASVSPLENKNTSTYKVWYREADVTASTLKELTNYANAYSVNGLFVFQADTTKSYVITLGVLDNFETSGIFKTTNGYAVIKMFSFMSKGLGIAFGKVADLTNGFDVLWDKIRLKGREEITIEAPAINIKENNASGFANKDLWYGYDQMGSGKVITLSGKLSEQKNGIVLIFSRNGEYGFTTVFVPKKLVGAYGAVSSVYIMGTSLFDYVGAKNLTISDTTITGHADNTKTATNATSGITYHNEAFYLRRVVGI